METLNVRNYRNALSASFDKAEKGEHIFIRRRNQIFALISLGPEDLMVTPQLQSRIEEAEKACKAGHCVTCSSKEEIENYLNNL